MTQNRENLRIRARVATAAQRWVAENRPADLLLPTGKPLVEAESLLEHGIELHQDEAGFIQASIARGTRIQRLKAGVVATVAVLAVLAGMSAFLANHQRKRAETETETAKETTNFMVRLFEVSDPSEARGNTITAKEIMDQGAKRIEKELSAQPRIQATLMETMGSVYTSLGLYDQAVALLQSALDKRKALYGEKHLEVAQSLDRLGEVLKLKAEYARALPMHREALALRREMLGNEHVDTARSVYELADLLFRMGDFAAGRTALPRSAGAAAQGNRREEPGSRAEHRGTGARPVRAGQVRGSRQAHARGGRDAARAARRAASPARASPEQSGVDARRLRTSTRKPSSCTGRRSR